MPHRTVVLSAPVRTAIGTFGGSLKETAGDGAGRHGHSRRPGADEARPCQGPDGGHGQCRPGRQQDEPGPAGGDLWRPARRGAGDDGEPRLRLRRAGDRLGGARDHARPRRLRDRRRHGEHGPGALSDGRRALGLSSRQRRDLRQHAARRPERRLLRPAFGMAHGGSGQISSDHARGAGPLGGALAEALRRRAGRRQVRGRDRAGRAAASATSRGSSRRTSTTVPTPRSRVSPSCARPSARTARSPPAMRRVSTAVPRR